jgi:hypothetical protein
MAFAHVFRPTCSGANVGFYYDEMESLPQGLNVMYGLKCPRENDRPEIESRRDGLNLAQDAVLG